jgi:LytS/YehU family sensor histidine kinase
MDQLQLEHKAINSLLNPHFVFNAINNIQNLVNKYRVDDANEYLARLSRLIRQNIENLQFNLITADKELSLIRNYIYLQNLRFGDKIHLQINNTADADKLCLPPLLIHTFVENSVVHGFSPDIKGFTITIDIHPDGKDYVAINITDNGLGLNKPTQAQQVLKDKTSIGVDATRRRLQKLSEFYKVDYKLDITDRQATEGTSGARVSIRFYAHFGNLLPVN